MNTIDRRTAIQWVLAAYASLTVAPSLLRATPITHLAPRRGYGTDPVLTKSYNPGDLWPLTLTESQRHLVAVLCDVIIPADEQSPSASAVGVPAFIDEWVSAPYDANVQDRKLILEGLAWLDDESQQRFGSTFTGASEAQRMALCDDICDRERAAPRLNKGAQFFARFRDLTAGGYYTSPEGMRDVGYTGNVPLAAFPPAPPELLAKLGLVQSL